MHVDLDHAGIGRDGEMQQPRIVAAADSLPAPPCGRTPAAVSSTAAVRSSQSSAREQRREEDVQLAAARLDRQRGAHQVRARRGRPPGRSCGTGRKPWIGVPRAAGAPRGGRIAWRGGSGARGANGSGSNVLPRSLSGSAQGRLPAAGAARSGESPGTRNSVSSRKNQLPDLPAPRAVLQHAAQRQHAADRRGQALARTRAPAAPAPADRAACCPRRPRWRAAGARATDSSGCPRAPG